MSEKTVRDMMIPLERYATVSTDATLCEAVVALEQAQRSTPDLPYPHRSVLVRDASGNIQGRISMWRVLMALEPKYQREDELQGVSRFGVDAQYVRSVMNRHDLLQSPLENLCKKASTIKVAQIMHVLEEGEYLEADAPLNVAIHNFVMSTHQSFMVRDGGGVVGIIRISDVFHEVCGLIKTCEVGG